MPARRRVTLTPASSLQLEPTFSPDEVGAHLGLCPRAVADLITFGLTYGSKLHPTRGGLYPTFKGAKLRRIPLSAIDRHKRHMARVNGEGDLPPTVVHEVSADTEAVVG